MTTRDMQVAEAVCRAAAVAAMRRQSISGAKWERFTAGKCAETIEAMDLAAIIAALPVADTVCAKPVNQQLLEAVHSILAPDMIDVLPAEYVAKVQAAIAAAEAAVPDWVFQFLNDVVTAAGLIEHGKRDRGLAERIGRDSYRMRAMLAAAPKPEGGAA